MAQRGQEPKRGEAQRRLGRRQEILMGNRKAETLVLLLASLSPISIPINLLLASFLASSLTSSKLLASHQYPLASFQPLPWHPPPYQLRIRTPQSLLDLLLGLIPQMCHKSLTSCYCWSSTELITLAQTFFAHDKMASLRHLPLDCSTLDRPLYDMSL